MSADFQLTVHGERAADFQRIFGSATVSVESAVPLSLNVGGEERLAYLLDLDELTEEQNNNLVQHLMAKYDATWDQVLDQIENNGMPILAEDTTMHIQRAMWFANDYEDEPFGLFDDIADDTF